MRPYLLNNEELQELEHRMKMDSIRFAYKKYLIDNKEK